MSAAYKGVLALLMQNGASDWRHGRRISEQVYDEEQIDLHHIFPVKLVHEPAPAHIRRSDELYPQQDPD